MSTILAVAAAVLFGTGTHLVLQRELTGSGKPRLVTKTPNDVFIADRIKTAWPDAKLIFLLRNPAAILR